MGLLDFFSKNKGSTTQTTTVTQTTQPPTDNMQPGFSNIQYPLPETTIPATFDASGAQAQSIPGVTDSSVQALPEISVPSTEEPENSDPSKHPKLPEINPQNSLITSTPEGVKVTTFEPVVQNTPMDLAPRPFEALPELQPVENLNNTQPQTQSDNLMQPVSGLENPLPHIQELQPYNQNLAVNDYVMPTTTAPVIEQPVTPLQPDIENTPVEDKLDIQALDLTVPPQTVTPQVEPPAEIDLNAQVGQELEKLDSKQKVNVEPELVKVVDVKPAESLEVTTQPMNVIEQPVAGIIIPAQDTIEILQPNSKPTELEIIPQIEPSVPELPNESFLNNIEESVKQTESIEKVEEQPILPKLTVLKRVAFIGLNCDTTNKKVSQKLSELVVQLLKSVEEFVLDSAKGYGSEIIKSLKDSEIPVTGVFLKPYYSIYSDDIPQVDQNSKLTVMVYSNSLERLRELIKKSDIFIIPETTGVMNLSELFTLWAIQNIYEGQSKPFILLGKSWKNLVLSLKDNFGLSQTELLLANICENVSDALKIIKDLDTVMAKEDKQPLTRIVDKREANDEREFIRAG